MNIGQEFERTLRSTADRLGVELQENLDEVRVYASQQMLALAAAVDEPGYDEVLVAAGVNVALKAAHESVESADALDREIVGTIIGALSIGARALA